MTDEQFVTIEDQGQLAGILHLPSKFTPPYPAIVYCPGKNGERFEVHRLAVKYARQLAANGIAFLRLDYYGIGLSDGNYFEMTNSTKVSNVLRAIEMMLNHPLVDPRRIALLGFSDGARIALMSANRAAVDLIALWSPLFIEIGGHLPGRRKPRFIRHPNWQDKFVLPWAGLWVGMEFYKDMKQIDLEKELNSYTGHSLIVYGEDDPLLQEEFEQTDVRKHRLYRNSVDNKVCTVPEAGHLFTSVTLENRLMCETTSWLMNRFIFEEGG